MDANVSLDIGKNLTDLIGALAKQIGTTADKVFPWYVKQQIIEGWMFFICASVSVLLSSAIFWTSMQKLKKEEGRYSYGTNDKYIPVAILSGIFIVITLMFVFLGSGMAMGKIINPEMGALKSMTSDMASLIGK